MRCDTDNMRVVFLEYKSDLLPVIAGLYDAYASQTAGLGPFPPSYWESVFLRPDIDPRRDLILPTRSGDDSESMLAAFCWIYTKPAPSHVYLRGPYLQPDDPDIDSLLDISLQEASRRAQDLGVEFIEGRGVHQPWIDAYTRLGFVKMGAYERMKLFPLVGTIRSREPRTEGKIRRYSGTSDLPILMKIFSSAFSSHWDYVPPRPGDWDEVFSSNLFRPELLRIAEEGGKPVGYVFGQFIPDYTLPTLQAVYLVSIALDPDHRGRGWGASLLSSWLRGVYEVGARAVELDVDFDNDVAKSLYTGYGFKYLRTEQVWRKYFN